MIEIFFPCGSTFTEAIEYMSDSFDGYYHYVEYKNKRWIGIYYIV